MTQDIDDLIARLESYENRDGFNRQLADALRAQRDKIARLTDALRQANGVRDVFASAVVASVLRRIGAGTDST